MPAPGGLGAGQGLSYREIGERLLEQGIKPQLSNRVVEGPFRDTEGRPNA